MDGLWNQSFDKNIIQLRSKGANSTLLICKVLYVPELDDNFVNKEINDEECYL